MIVKSTEACKWVNVALGALEPLGDATEEQWRAAFARDVGRALSVSSIRTTFGRAVDWLLKAGQVRIYAGSSGDRLMRIVRDFDRESNSISSVIKQIERVEAKRAANDAELARLRTTLAELLKGE